MEIKKFIYGILFFVLGTCVLTSCNNEELLSYETDVTNEEDIENAAINIGFISLKDRINFAKKKIDSSGKWRLPANKSNNIVIFKARIAREKYNCARGFGLCDIVILGKPISKIAEIVQEAENNPQFFYGLVENDSLKKDYVDFMLSDHPEVNGISKMPDFVIDGDIEKDCLVSDTVKTYTVSANSYKYQETIGPNGGFRLYVDSTKK